MLAKDGRGITVELEFEQIMGRVLQEETGVLDARPPVPPSWLSIESTAMGAGSLEQDLSVLLVLEDETEVTWINAGRGSERLARPLSHQLVPSEAQGNRMLGLPSKDTPESLDIKALGLFEISHRKRKVKTIRSHLLNPPAHQIRQVGEAQNRSEMTTGPRPRQ